MVDFKPGPAELLYFSVPNMAQFNFLSKFHPKFEFTSAGQPVLSLMLVTAGDSPVP